MTKTADLLPMDLVRLPNGDEAVVNSAAYWDGARQKFTVCPLGGSGPYPGPMYFADECELIHRCDFKPYGPVRRCECGAQLGDCPKGDLAWRAMNAIVDRVEDESQAEERGTTLGYGIAYAAFWLGSAAVLVALIWRLA